jgi:hypothetical protein
MMLNTTFHNISAISAIEVEVEVVVEVEVEFVIVHGSWIYNYLFF